MQNSGIDSIRLYDPFLRKFTWTSKMGEGRWYSSVATLPNGLVSARTAARAVLHAQLSVAASGQPHRGRASRFVDGPAANAPHCGWHT